MGVVAVRPAWTAADEGPPWMYSREKLLGSPAARMATALRRIEAPNDLASMASTRGNLHAPSLATRSAHTGTLIEEGRRRSATAALLPPRKHDGGRLHHLLCTAPKCQSQKPSRFDLISRDVRDLLSRRQQKQHISKERQRRARREDPKPYSEPAHGTKTYDYTYTQGPGLLSPRSTGRQSRRGEGREEPGAAGSLSRKGRVRREKGWGRMSAAGATSWNCGAAKKQYHCGRDLLMYKLSLHRY